MLKRRWEGGGAMLSDGEAGQVVRKLHEAIVKMDEQAAVELSGSVLRHGIDPRDAIVHGVAAAMDTVAGLYADQEYYVPELLLCADTAYAALDILKPHVKPDQTQTKGRILIGVVEGDIHDIGKNLVKVMFDATGWTVYDLGKDVKLERFVEEQVRTEADIVAISALLTTSMIAMPRVIQMVKAQSPDTPVIVGGAPLNQHIAERFGADGYADNAASAVGEAKRLIETRRAKTH
jgi:methanogenic corrinoid protein MtbC1